MFDKLRSLSLWPRNRAADAASAYRTQGFFLFRQAIDRQLIDDVAKAEEAFVRPYRGPLLRHNGAMESHDHSKGPPSAPEQAFSGLFNSHRSSEPAIRPFSEAVARLLTSADLFDCLHELDGSERYTLHQSIFFFVSTRCDIHPDRVTLDTAPLGRSFTVWIPIDSVRPANGPLFVVPRALGAYDDLTGLAVGGQDRHQTILSYQAAVGRKVGASEAIAVLPMMHPGDVMIFAPSTPHGSFGALNETLWRRSFQAIYRPTAVTRWGAYPTHDELHVVQDEETEVTSRFNFLHS